MAGAAAKLSAGCDSKAGPRRVRVASAPNIQGGIRDGSCRPCDATPVSEMAAGTFVWRPRWLPETCPMSPTQIADVSCDLLAFGLSADRATGTANRGLGADGSAF